MVSLGNGSVGTGRGGLRRNEDEKGEVMGHYMRKHAATPSVVAKIAAHKDARGIRHVGTHGNIEYEHERQRHRAHRPMCACAWGEGEGRDASLGRGTGHATALPDVCCWEQQHRREVKPTPLPHPRYFRTSIHPVICTIRRPSRPCTYPSMPTPCVSSQQQLLQRPHPA